MNDNRIRFGIVGTGKITTWVLTAARQDERFQPLALMSRSREHGEAFAREWGIERVYTTMDDLCQDADIDAVYIATPNATHHDMAMKAILSGKHVLCEKPMASNSWEVEDMITAARKKGVLLMEAMIATVNPNFLTLKENLPRLGVIRRYFASYCQYSSRYDAFKQGNVANAFKPELSNGSLMDIGVYTVYPMVALFGKPLQIHAEGVLLSTGVDGQGSATFLYDGMNATVQFSKIANSYLPSEIEGEDGNIIMDSMQIIRSLKFCQRPQANSGRGPKAVFEEIGRPLEKDEEYLSEIREFLDCLEAGRMESRLNRHDYSLWTAQVMEEMRRQMGIVYPSDNNFITSNHKTFVK